MKRTKAMPPPLLPRESVVIPFTQLLDKAADHLISNPP